MPLTLYYHPLSSFCWKALIALYENGAPFEARIVDLGDPEAVTTFKALWPTAKIPLLQDDGRVLPETSIMIEYLDRRHPGRIALLPGGFEEQLQCRLWDRLYDLYVMDPMGRFIAQQLRPATGRDERAITEALEQLTGAYAMLEDRIGARSWAAGECFSMADCAAAPALFYASIVQPFPPGHIRLASYFERLMARPSVRRVIAGARPWFQYFPLHQAIPARFLSDGADAS